MSTISNERLEEMRDYDTCVRLDESAAMATELLALRKERERAEPVVVPDCFLNAVSALESLYRNGQKQCWHERYTTDMAYASGVLNACRAAMLNQAPVKQPSSNKVVEPVVCPKCGNTGSADSGGVQPWGEPILIECDCTAPPAPTDKPKSEMSQQAEQLLRDTTALAVTLSAETDTTPQQFESLAGKAVVPEGWKLVPVQPTQAMCDAVLGWACFTFNGDGAKRIYEAMLGAAPEPCK